MRTWGIKPLRAALALLLVLSLSGCGDALLERSYSSVTPHSAAYREREDADTLRAENYQDLVNALLMLLGEHSEEGVVRVYGDDPDKAALAENACVEVQKETAIGAYLLDYITYDGSTESGYYELRVRFGYRRTAEEQAAIINASSTEALPDLLRAALHNDAAALAVRVGWFGTDRAGVLALVGSVHDEVYPPPDAEAAADGLPEPQPEPQPEPTPESTVPPATPEPAESTEEPEPPEEPELAPWALYFYPNAEQPGIIEVVLKDPDTKQ